MSPFFAALIAAGYMGAVFVVFGWRRRSAHASSV
jgi:hypothetical protein